MSPGSRPAASMRRTGRREPPPARQVWAPMRSTRFPHAPLDRALVAVRIDVDREWLLASWVLTRHLGTGDTCLVRGVSTRTGSERGDAFIQHGTAVRLRSGGWTARTPHGRRRSTRAVTAHRTDRPALRSVLQQDGLCSGSTITLRTSRIVCVTAATRQRDQRS